MTVKQSPGKVFEIVASKDDDSLEGAEPFPVALPGDGEIITLNPPSSTAFMMLMATARAGTDTEAAVDVINAFMSLLDEEDAREVRGRLFDRKDPLELGGVTDAFMAAMEQWSGRPINAPGRSPSSRSSSGKTSQAKRSSTASGSKRSRS